MGFLKNKEREVQEAVQVKEAEILQLNETIADLEKQLEEAQDNAEMAATYKAEFERVSGELEERDQRIQDLEALVETQNEHAETVDTQVASMVQEVTANLGVEAVEIQEEEEGSDLTIQERFSQMTSDERLKFYRENREELLKSLKGGQ